MEQTERRRDIRARISIPTFVVRRSGAESVEMIDASYRGLFLRFDETPPVRELLKLRVHLPSKELEIHAVVVRLVEDALGRPGVGLRFFALNGQDKTDWESFISGILSTRAKAA